MEKYMETTTVAKSNEKNKPLLRSNIEVSNTSQNNSLSSHDMRLLFSCCIAAFIE